MFSQNDKVFKLAANAVPLAELALQPLAATCQWLIERFFQQFKQLSLSMGIELCHAPRPPSLEPPADGSSARDIVLVTSQEGIELRPQSPALAKLYTG